MKNINQPCDKKTITSLELGEVVSITGPIVTARDEAHMRALEKNTKPLECFKGSIVYHCGPIMKTADNKNMMPVQAGPTTSARMNSLEPEFIRKFDIHAIIGKGGMNAQTQNAMKEIGCVYLAAIGGCAVSYAESLGPSAGVEWEDLGMAESVWKFNATNFGPLVVAIDQHGNSLYEQVEKAIKRS